MTTTTTTTTDGIHRAKCRERERHASAQLIAHCDQLLCYCFYLFSVVSVEKRWRKDVTESVRNYL